MLKIIETPRKFLTKDFALWYKRRLKITSIPPKMPTISWIDIFMPEDNCARLDVWVTTKIIGTLILRCRTGVIRSFMTASGFTMPTKHFAVSTSTIVRVISNPWARKNAGIGFMNCPKQSRFGFAISAYSSRKKFSRTLGRSIAKTMSKTAPRKSGHDRFSPKISILTLERPRLRLGNKNMQAYFCCSRLARYYS